MRRAAIAQATAQCDHLDFGGVLNLRPAFRAVLTSLAVCLVAALLVILNPAAAGCAGPGPAAGQRRLAAGDAPRTEESGRSRRPRPAAGDRSRSRPRGKAPRYMPRVLSPPRRPGQAQCGKRGNASVGPVNDCAAGEHHPPAGIPRHRRRRPFDALDADRRTRSAGGRVAGGGSCSARLCQLDEREARRGFRRADSGRLRVELSGEASKPLRSAALQLDGDRELPARIEGGGRSFRIGKPSRESPAGLVLDKSCGYTVALVDRDGIHGGEENWQFRVQADSPPAIVIEQPNVDLFVTPRPSSICDWMPATTWRCGRQLSCIPHRAPRPSAKRRFRSTKDRRNPRPAPRLPMKTDRAAITGPSTAGGVLKTSSCNPARNCRFMPLRPTTAGRPAAASRGRSPSSLRKSCKTAWLRDRAKSWRNWPACCSSMRNAREGVRAVRFAYRNRAASKPGEIDILQSADSTPAQIARSLTDRDDGASALAISVLADLETSRIDNPDCARRMQDLLAEFDRLQREHLVPIGDELTAAVKGMQIREQSSPRPVDRDADDDSHLARAGKHQQDVIDARCRTCFPICGSGTTIGGSSGMWPSFFTIRRTSPAAAAELGRQTLGRDLKELSPQDTADLKALAERQAELARRQNRIEQEMEQTIPLLRPGEPLAADTLGDVLAEARRLAIAAAMQSVAEKIRDNGLGQVPADHQTILQNLQAVLDILANNRSQESQRLARELGASARDLDGLRKRQEGLRRRLDKLAAAVGKGQANEKQKAELRALSPEQEQIRQETLRLGRRLERLLAREPADSTNKAAEKMKQAETAGAGGSATTASQDAKTAEDHLADADKKLRQRQDELRARNRPEATGPPAGRHSASPPPGVADRERNAGIRRLQTQRPP